MALSLLLIWIAGVIYAIFYLVPPVEGLGYLVRIAFLHIPAAWVSVMAFLLAAGWAMQYLRTRQIGYDLLSSTAVGLGLVFCILATVSGTIFAKLTWGSYWNWDPRQTTISMLLLVYGAYLVLRLAIVDDELRARMAAAYSLLSAATVPFLVFLIPRYYFSLHPEPVLNSSGKLEMDTILLWVLLAAVGACSALFLQLLNHTVSKKKERQRQREATAKQEVAGP